MGINNGHNVVTLGVNIISRPQEEVAGKVFDILRSIDETMTNLTSEVSFDAKQKKLTLKNTTLNNTL